MQLAAGGLPVKRRRKYRKHEWRLNTIKEKYEAGDYTLRVLYNYCLLIIRLIENAHILLDDTGLGFIATVQSG